MNGSWERRCKAGPALADSLPDTTPGDTISQKGHTHTH